MAVAIDDMPARCAIAGEDVLARRKRDVTIDGDIIIVPEDIEAAEAQRARKAHRLMVDAFHQAAIAGDYPGTVIDQIIAIDSVEMPLGHRHADRHREALAQRAGGALDARHLEILGVSGTRAVQLTEIADVVHRRLRIATEVQQRVDEHRAMARRQHEAVAIRPARRARIELQMIAEQHRRHIGHAHRHPRMPAVGRLNRIHRQRPDRIGKLLFGDGHEDEAFISGNGR